LPGLTLPKKDDSCVLAEKKLPSPCRKNGRAGCDVFVFAAVVVCFVSAVFISSFFDFVDRYRIVACSSTPDRPRAPDPSLTIPGEGPVPARAI
jgi:hypothetical protein